MNFAVSQLFSKYLRIKFDMNREIRRCVVSFSNKFFIPLLMAPLRKMCHKVSIVMRKPDFCICENKDADQLRGNWEADQRLCFRYTDSTIPLLSESEISRL